MFYVYEISRNDPAQAINVADANNGSKYSASETMTSSQVEDVDIDFVDDTLLNTAPHNPIEQQLLRGDMVGLALMSGAILWSAMGAFG